MIWRHHDDGHVQSRALYSECARYRHALHRRWGQGAVLGWVLLNPSSATELVSDATLTRCTLRAQRAGYGAIAVANLFAFRATDPRDMQRALDPIGPGADAALTDALSACDRVICGWGNQGYFLGRAAQVRALLSGWPLFHLGLTLQGQPRHPLYVARETPLLALA